MNIGDYVRTKKDGIGRIISFSYQEDDECCFIELSNRRTGIKQFNIIKSSPNIIDLIEEGDYVNGYKVLFAGAITWDNDGNVIDKRVKINYGGYDRWLSEDYIKSIVTKEQFEAMKYEIK